MNLLIDQWIPVRPLESGGAVKISLRELLCGEGKWELCLPRDDMELAAMQLLICITQALFTPIDGKELLTHISRPITAEEYETASRNFADWFCVDHPKQPFMQVRGVEAKDPTPMDKLLAGLTGATNCCFVNENGLSDQLCGGCTCIALFNLGSCSPSFGGGFKPGLRGPATPITTLIQGRHLPLLTIFRSWVQVTLIPKSFPAVFFIVMPASMLISCKRIRAMPRVKRCWRLLPMCCT